MYSNRSAAHAKAGNYAAALKDANQTVSLNPTWSKGYSRKGSALAYLGEFDEAIAAYEKGRELEPINQQLAQGLIEVKKQAEEAKLRTEQLFEKLRSNPQTRDWLKDPEYVKIVEVSYFCNHEMHPIGMIHNYCEGKQAVILTNVRYFIY